MKVLTVLVAAQVVPLMLSPLEFSSQPVNQDALDSDFGAALVEHEPPLHILPRACRSLNVLNKRKKEKIHKLRQGKGTTSIQKADTTSARDTYLAQGGRAGARPSTN